MIKVDILKKAKGSKNSNLSTSTGYYSGGSTVEADHAAMADNADHASKADNADEAAHAASAAGLDGNSSVWTTIKGWISNAIGTLEDVFLSKTDDDTANGLITFLKGVKVGDGKFGITEKGIATLASIVSDNWDIEEDGSIVAYSISSSDFDKDEKRGFTIAVVNSETGQYELCIDNIIAWGKAVLGSLQVKGDSTFEGTLSSPKFISGFLDGVGWRIKGETVNNAAGVPEQRYTEEIDNLIVRGTMRVFEMVISQLLGENDNRIFTGMLEVDHYDPETGKVYLDTKEGRYYNPFRKDDYIMVQQYNGMPSVENNHYVTKHYELIVTEAGSEGTGEDMLAWVKFRNFTTTMEGGTPENLITKKDTFVRVDNLTDTDRKGIVTITTVGSNTPYSDVIYGLKTDPENALKGRIGNLQGIIHPLFGALKGFGAYLMNLYATGDLILRRTGESMDTKIQMLADQFATRYTRTQYELTDDNNYLHNGQFLTSIGDGDSDNPIIDGWTIDETDDTQFWVDDSGLPIIVNGYATASGLRRVTVENDEGRQTLRIMNCGISQKNALIDQPKTHKEYVKPTGKDKTTTDSNGKNPVTTKTATDGSAKDVQDTLYVSVRIYAMTTGTLTVGFSGSTDVAGKANDLKSRDITVNYSGEWQTVEFNGKWNGTGDFVLRYTGDCRVAFVAVTDTALANLARTVSTSIEQTAEAIKLLGQNDDAIAGKYTGLGLILDATNKKLEALVSTAQTKEDAENQVRQLSELIDAVDTKTGNNATLIQQQADRIGILAGHFDNNGHLTELSGYITTAQYNELVSTVGGNKEENQRQINALKDVIDGVDSKVGNNATLIQQQADRIGTLAGHFDDNGHLTELSGYITTAEVNEMFSSKFNDNGELKDKTGIVTTTDFQGWKNGDYTRDKQNLQGLIDNKLDTTAFASMYASSVANDTSIVKTASMSVYVQKDGNNYISNAKIKADKIELEGLTTVNSNFKVLEDGSIEAVNGKFTGEINATSGKIGGFNINGSYIGIKNGFTDTSVDGMWLTNTELGFNGTDGRQTIIGTWFATGMGNLLGRFLDTGNDISAKRGIVIDVSNSMMDNVAMEFGGGCVAGLALKTATYGLEQITKSTFTGTYNGKTQNLDQIPIFDTLPRLANAVVVSTMFYYRNAEKENGKDKEYTTYARDRYITLPDVTDADDGHVVMIKRGQGSGGTVHIRAGNYKQLLYNISTHAYYTETSKCYLLVDKQNTIAGTYDSDKRAIVDGEYQLQSESDASTFVFFRNYSVTVQGNSGTLKKTYKGCWVQWKNPRDW